MDEPVALRQNRHWQSAVTAMRVGYLALVVALIGVVLVIAGSTPWVLAAGVIAWIVVAVITVTSVLQARAELAEPRPGLWSLRFMLVRDTFGGRG